MPCPGGGEPALGQGDRILARLTRLEEADVFGYRYEAQPIKRLPKETFGILISMEPAVTALWALLLLHERLGGLQWLAIGCTVLASVGSTMTARGRRPAS